jgi:hypothetical protein
MWYPNSTHVPPTPTPPTAPYAVPFQYLPTPNAYDPVGVLIDRKTDNPPPPALWIDPHFLGTVNITATSGHTGDFIDYTSYSPPLLNTSPNGSYERVKLAHSHYIKNNRWSAFIQAFKPIPNMKGKLLFFFPEGFANTHTQGPKYGLVNLQPNSALQPQLARYFGTANARYHDVLIYDIPDTFGNIDGLGDNLEEELRLFHFLQAPGQIADPILPFMVMLVTESEPDQAQWGNLIQTNHNNDFNFISGYVDPQSRTVTYNDHANPEIRYFYIDADTLQIAKGEPKDPNYLTVKQVCKCNGSDKYLVTFELRFCNVSTYTSKNAEIFVEDLTGGKFKCFNSIPIGAGTDLGNTGNILDGRCLPVGPACSNIPYPRRRDGNFCLKYEAIFKDRTTTGFSNCHIFQFTAQTDADGLKALTKYGAIRAGVHFRETRCELIYAYSDSATIDANCRADCPRCPERCITTWPLVIIGILALCSLIYWWNSRRKRLKKMQN